MSTREGGRRRVPVVDEHLIGVVRLRIHPNGNDQGESRGVWLREAGGDVLGDTGGDTRSWGSCYPGGCWGTNGHDEYANR